MSQNKSELNTHHPLTHQMPGNMMPGKTHLVGVYMTAIETIRGPMKFTQSMQDLS